MEPETAHIGPAKKLIAEHFAIEPCRQNHFSLHCFSQSANNFINSRCAFPLA